MKLHQEGEEGEGEQAAKTEGQRRYRDEEEKRQEVRDMWTEDGL